VPLLGFAQAGAGGFFDDGGFPAGHGWDQVDAPTARDDGIYALKVTGDSMMPVYRDGDTIIVSPTREARAGDRVVVKTRDGEVMAKVLEKKTQKAVQLASLNPDHPKRTVPVAEVEWIARILWASQ
jgi:phage repressor protein C with HTH and peptisase S24 domain